MDIWQQIWTIELLTLTYLGYFIYLPKAYMAPRLASYMGITYHVASNLSLKLGSLHGT